MSGGDRRELNDASSESRTWDAPRAGASVLGVVATTSAVVGLVSDDGRDVFASVGEFLWPVWLVVLLALLVCALTALLLARRGKPSPEPQASSGAEARQAPVQAATPLVGRRAELDGVLGKLKAEGHIVTVWGTGGVGKTRLCREAGVELELPGDPAFVDLTAARTGRDVAEKVAQELGGLPEGQSPADAVANMLELGAARLVILDNFEQVNATASENVVPWSMRARDCRFLVSSREPLAVANELLVPLEPFAAADDAITPESLVAQPPDAVVLFRDRAQAGSDFVLTPGNVRDVAKLCELVGGIPLLIEMAAAGLRYEPELSTWAGKVEHSIDVLCSRRRDVAKRHGTLAALVDSSTSTMEPEHQSGLLQAAAFRAHFSLEALAHVTGLDEARARSLRDVLVDKSLARPAGSVGGEPRYGLYVAIREYCREVWQRESTTEQQAALAERFAGYFVGRATEWDAAIDTGRIGEVLNRLEADHDNLMAVHDRALKRGDVVTAARAYLSSCQMLHNRRTGEDRIRPLERLVPGLAGAAEHALLVRVHLALCLADHAANDLGAGEQAIEAATSALERLGGGNGSSPPPERAPALHSLAGDVHLWRAVIAIARGSKGDAAASDLDAADAEFAAAGDRRGRAKVHIGRGSLVLVREQQLRSSGTKALAEYGKALEQLEGVDAPRTRLLVLHARTMPLELLGRYEEGLQALKEIEGIVRGFGISYLEPFIQNNRARLLLRLAHHEAAAEAFGSLAEERRRLGQKWMLADALMGRSAALIRSDALAQHEAEALRTTLEAERLFDELSEQTDQAAAGAAIARSNRALIHIRCGSPHSALEPATAAVEQFARFGDQDIVNRFMLSAVLAQAKAATGAPDARVHIERALEFHEPMRGDPQEHDTEVRRNYEQLLAIRDGVGDRQRQPAAPR